jgi:hypothetical protein
MNFDWYVFEESYLLDIDYRVAKCSLRLTIDARKSVSHPDAIKIKSYEDSFEEIELDFIGVQYYKGVSSLNLSTDPNEDIGSIDSMSVSEFDEEDGIRFNESDQLYKWLIENNKQVITQIPTKTVCTKVLEFVSDYISMRVGFSDYTIKRLPRD